VKSGHISPKTVRYIKLGEGGQWEQSCLRDGTNRLGFGTERPDRFELCVRRRWKDVTASWLESGRDKGTATRFTNELRRFFEDDGSTLWITFIGERLYWGFHDESPPKRHPDGHGAIRNIRGGWKYTDSLGDELTKDRLSGALTKLAMYRGTSCDVDASAYVVDRINGKKRPQVEAALKASSKLRDATVEMMRLLVPKDFELLVDLVFSASGWRRVGVVGKTQKTIDLDLILPSTGERAFVQVKSKTTSAQLADYVAQIQDGPFGRMFYVYHSGHAQLAEPDARVTVVGPEAFAEMVMDAGFVSWLIRKVS
jgi:hypothetical protein